MKEVHILGQANVPEIPELTDLTINPHGLTADDLREYEPCYWPLLLLHGRQKFGLANLILGTNGALNALGDVGRRHGTQKTMIPMLDIIAQGLAMCFTEICQFRGWTPAELKALQAEVVKVQVTKAAPKILSHNGTTTLN